MIEVKRLTKIFGPDPKRARQLLDQGWSKEKIYQETKMTVGVNQAEFTINQGR